MKRIMLLAGAFLCTFPANPVATGSQRKINPEQKVSSLYQDAEKLLKEHPYTAGTATVFSLALAWWLLNHTSKKSPEQNTSYAEDKEPPMRPSYHSPSHATSEKKTGHPVKERRAHHTLVDCSPLAAGLDN